jgi:hypothetical protein
MKKTERIEIMKMRVMLGMIMLSGVALHGSDDMEDQQSQMSPEEQTAALRDMMASQGVAPEQISKITRNAQELALFNKVMDSRAFVEATKQVAIKDVSHARQIAFYRMMNYNQRAMQLYEHLSFMRPLFLMMGESNDLQFEGEYAHLKKQCAKLSEGWNHETSKWHRIMPQFMDDPLVVACKELIPTVIAGREVLKNAIENKLTAALEVK